MNKFKLISGEEIQISSNNELTWGQFKRHISWMQSGVGGNMYFNVRHYIDKLNGTELHGNASIYEGLNTRIDGSRHIHFTNIGEFDMNKMFDFGMVYDNFSVKVEQKGIIYQLIKFAGPNFIWSRVN